MLVGMGVFVEGTVSTGGFHVRRRYHHMVCRHPCCVIAIPNMMTDLLLVGLEMFVDGTVSNRCSQTVTINMIANSRSEAPVGCLCHATRIVCMT